MRKGEIEGGREREREKRFSSSQFLSEIARAKCSSVFVLRPRKSAQKIAKKLFFRDSVHFRIKFVCKTGSFVLMVSRNLKTALPTLTDKTGLRFL